MKDKYWTLDENRELVETEDPIVWAEWFENNREARKVGLDWVGTTKISTVFLGLNHAWDPRDRPLIFETLIFGGEHDGCLWRYSTLREAEEGHKSAVNWVKSEVTKAMDEQEKQAPEPETLTPEGEKKEIEELKSADVVKVDF